MNQPTTHDIEIGRRILRSWCQDNNLAIDPVAGSDLVQKIAEAIAVIRGSLVGGPAQAVGMPIDPPHAVISAAMQEIPEDGCEYEHIEAAYRAMRVALSSTDDKLAAGTGPASRGGPSPESASPHTSTHSQCEGK